MGLTGLAYQNNAVTYLTNCYDILSYENKKIYGSVFS